MSSEETKKNLSNEDFRKFFATSASSNSSSSSHKQSHSRSSQNEDNHHKRHYHKNKKQQTKQNTSQYRDRAAERRQGLSTEEIDLEAVRFSLRKQNEDDLDQELDNSFRGEESNTKSETQAKQATAQAIKFNTHIGRKVYNLLSLVDNSGAEKHKVPEHNESFLPGRTTYIFETIPPPLPNPLYFSHTPSSSVSLQFSGTKPVNTSSSSTKSEQAIEAERLLKEKDQILNDFPRIITRSKESLKQAEDTSIQDEFPSIVHSLPAQLSLSITRAMQEFREASDSSVAKHRKRRQKEIQEMEAAKKKEAPKPQQTAPVAIAKPPPQPVDDDDDIFADAPSEYVPQSEPKKEAKAQDEQQEDEEAMAGPQMPAMDEGSIGDVSSYYQDAEQAYQQQQEQDSLQRKLAEAIERQKEFIKLAKERAESSDQIKDKRYAGFMKRSEDWERDQEKVKLQVEDMEDIKEHLEDDDEGEETEAEMIARLRQENKGLTQGYTVVKKDKGPSTKQKQMKASKELQAIGGVMKRKYQTDISSEAKESSKKKQKK